MSSDNKSQLYNSLGGKTKTKFDFSNHKKAQSIGQDNFFKWTSGNMYRTSYNDMSNKGQSVERKNCVIPKYAGFVPTLKADSHLQKRITEQSRDVLHKNYIDDKGQTMSSTGFNQVHIPKHDTTLMANSRFHGCQTLIHNHPNNFSKYESNETTFRSSYRNPRSQAKSVFRTRNPSTEFTDEKNLNVKQMVTDKTNLNGPRQVLIDNCSGYVMNSTLWDNTSWATEQNVHTDQRRTQYRKQFNQPKPFQNRRTLLSTGRLPKNLLSYEPADMKTTGFGLGTSFYGKPNEAVSKKNLNWRRFEDNGKCINIDQR